MELRQDGPLINRDDPNRLPKVNLTRTITHFYEIVKVYRYGDETTDVVECAFCGEVIDGLIFSALTESHGIIHLDKEHHTVIQKKMKEKVDEWNKQSKSK